MSSLREASINIKGYSYRFFRRFEESDLPWRNKDYVPFVVTSAPENNPEVLFSQSDETLKRLEDEYPQEIFATGEIYPHHPDKKIDKMNLHAKSDSTMAERKIWAETAVGRINSMVLQETVWIAINQKEFYIYKRPLDYYLKHPKTEIFRVFASI